MHYKRTILICTLIMILIVSCTNKEKEETLKPIENIEIDTLFEGYDGCFVLYDQNANHYEVYNERRLNDRVPPCSTFKIVNSLIGLDSGVIKDKYTKYEWDGTNHTYDIWNQDHTLETAIANSVVWYYQRLASEVGTKRMQQYIDKVDYGNKDISGGITEFWLQSTLEISPKEQIRILRDLYNFKLPFKKEHMEIVQDILILEEEEGYVLSGKTGSGGNGKNAWFIGSLEYKDNRYYFATNILGEKDASGSKAKEITLEILEIKGLSK